MQARTQKIISSLLLGLVVILGFQALIYILNLNQAGLFFRSAFYIWLYLMFYIALVYDLHFKTRGNWSRAALKHQDVAGIASRKIKIFFSALSERVQHLGKIAFLRHWLNYLILPTLVFWGTVGVFYVNFGFYKIQQITAILSSVALLLNFYFLKEVFIRQKIKVDPDIFITLSVVKIYAVTLVYAASLSLVRHYCLDPKYFALGIFTLTFLLIYQALFQHDFINSKNLGISLVISLVLAVAGYFLVIFWGYNYFTGAVFLAVFYNLLWGIFHYSLDRMLNVKVFLEIAIISLILASMVFGVTNFKAQLLDGCQYQISLFTM